MFKVADSFLDAPCMPSIICALRICYALLWRISSEQQMNENIDNRPALLTFLRLVHRVSFLYMAFTECQDLTRSQLSLRIRVRDQTCLRDCNSIFEYISLLSKNNYFLPKFKAYFPVRNAALEGESIGDT